MQDFQIGKKELKLSLLTDNSSSLGNPHTKKALELVNELSKGAGYKVSTDDLSYRCTLTRNKRKKEIICSYSSVKRIIYLRICLTKEWKYFHNGN